MSRGSRWTIDYRGSGFLGNDRNGYLENARTWMPGHREHDSVDALVRNVEAIAAKTKRPTIHVVGHGQPGRIGAGCGDTLSGEGAYLDAKRSSRFVTVRHRVEAIVLWGCHVGAGEEGVELLGHLAAATGAMCMAPTGRICCCAQEGFSPESASCWQVVLPFGRQPPEPIAPPVYQMPTPERWRLMDANGEPCEMAQFSAQMSGAPQPFPVDALRAVAFHDPLDQCALGSFVTGFIHVRFASGAEKCFRVLGEQVLENPETGECYPATPAFSKALKAALDSACPRERRPVS